MITDGDSLLKNKILTHKHHVNCQYLKMMKNSLSMENRSLLENLNSILYLPRAQSDRIVRIRVSIARIFAKVENCSQYGKFGIRADGTWGSQATIFRSLVFLTHSPPPLYTYTPTILQRHVCITRSTAALPAGVVCGKALLAPRVPQLNSQAFRLIYGPEVEATLPCALRLLSPLRVHQVTFFALYARSIFLRLTVSPVHLAQMRSCILLFLMFLLKFINI